MRWIDDAKALQEQGIPFVLATLIESEGSAPRDAGAKMLIPRMGKAMGTIGGGVLEAAVIAASHALFSRGGSEIFEYRYPQSGCGGSVKVFLECVEPPRRLVIFGGGHIGHALASVMVQTSFHVRVIEERPETLEKFDWPAGVEIVSLPFEEAAERLSQEENLVCVVAGFSAHQDTQILSSLLPLQWRYLGVLGSRSKGERLREHLRAYAVSEERMEKFFCPAGAAGIGNKLPGEIAISIAAQILSL